MNLIKKISCAVGLMLAVTPSVFSAGSDLSGQVKRILEAGRQKYGTPGMVATLIRNGQITETIAVGFADKENQRPMLAGTLVPAASLTKLMTAVLVMRQVEKNRLGLDRPADDYLPPAMKFLNREGQVSTASLRHLLSHSSGLPVAWKPIAIKGDQVESLEKYLSRGLRTIFEPGERIMYANDGFSFAGYIAAQAEKEDFATHTTRILLKPLKMETSTFVSPWTLQSPPLARAYGSLMGGSELSTHNDLTAALPAGGLISTAPELARFALMLLRGGELDGEKIISRESVDELFTIQALPYTTSKVGFGLGFAVRETDGRKLVWWDGGVAGVANRMILHPESQSGVVLLSNLSDNAASSEVANAILDLLVKPPAPPRYTPTPDELERFSGNYRFYYAVDPRLWFLRYGIDLKITPENGTLHYDSRLLRSGALLPVGPGLFRLTDSRLAGLDVFFDGSNIFFLELRAQKIPFYSSATAMAIYALLVIVVMLYLVFRLLRGFVRKLRKRSA